MHLYRLSPSWLLIVILLFFFCFSFLAFLHPWLNTLFFIAVCLLTLIASIVKLEFGLLLAFTELTTGGHGYMFALPILGYSVSLRMAIFIIIFICWVLFLWKRKRAPAILRARIRFSLLCVLCFVVFGIINGLINNTRSLVFFDANAYFALGYVMILFDCIISTQSRQRIITVISSAAVFLSILTILLLGIFAFFYYDTSLHGAVSVDEKILAELDQTSNNQIMLGQQTNIPPEKLILHPEDVTKTKPAVYRWLRDTGIGQVSYISNHFFRIFFPSQIFVSVWFIIFLSAILTQKNNRKILDILTGILILAALFISYSRSIWIGLAGGVLTLMIWLISTRLRRVQKLSLIVVLFSFLLIISISAMSIPVISSRVSSILNPKQEVAGTHRIELAKALFVQIKKFPILGSGYGTVVVFPTVFPNGQVANVAFYVYEWAYLDIMVKIGLLGFFSFIWLLVHVGKIIIRSIRITENTMYIGVFSGFLALCFTNISTPVFTHPLGLAGLAILLAISIQNNENSTNSNSHLE